MNNISREITPINDDDLFILLDNPNAQFDYPFHFHSEFELNLVLGLNGERIVGDISETFNTLDLVLIAPNVPHCWRPFEEKGNHVITIQFHEELLNFPMLKTRMFLSIKQMLENSGRGIQFYGENAIAISAKILKMSQNVGFEASLDFLSLLYDLAVSPNKKFIASSFFDVSDVIRESKSRRITQICNYINKNYMHSIKIADLANLVSMSESSVSHFFKNRTKRNIVDYINEIRIGNATKLLFETTHSISEICFNCGFNNISNFNRVFKNSKGCTPSSYRENIRIFLKKY